VGQVLWFRATTRVRITGEWLVGELKLASGVRSKPNFEKADGTTWCMDRFCFASELFQYDTK